jgi:hypothetical protein
MEKAKIQFWDCSTHIFILLSGQLQFETENKNISDDAAD